MNDSEYEITGGRIVTPDGVIEGDLVVREGLIAEIAPSAGRRRAGSFDARGCFVLPGGVDPHSHALTNLTAVTRSAALRRDDHAADVHPAASRRDTDRRLRAGGGYLQLRCRGRRRAARQLLRSGWRHARPAGRPLQARRLRRAGVPGVSRARLDVPRRPALSASCGTPLRLASPCRCNARTGRSSRS